MERKVESALKIALSDFEPDANCTYPYRWGDGFLDLSADQTAALPPYSVFLAFVTFSHFPYAGRSEKVAWAIPVKFRGIPFVLTHLKFGFRVYPGPSDISAKLSRELLGRLRRAVHFADKLIRPFALAQLSAGNITVQNRYSLFRGRYEFLRKMAEEHYAAPPPPPEPIVDAEGKRIGTSSQPFTPEFEGFYLASAAVDAWFSLLEHVLVILLPFSNFDPATESLSEFVLSKWSVKFKRIFRLTQDREAERLFQSLADVKSRLRNPLTHGGFDQDGHVFHFHAPGLGAIPLTMSGYTKSIHFSITPIQHRSFEEVCMTLDSADSFLNNRPKRMAMTYVRSGLDVSFNHRTIALYGAAMASEADMEEFIERMGWEHDNAANMDW